MPQVRIGLVVLEPHQPRLLANARHGDELRGREGGKIARDQLGAAQLRGAAWQSMVVEVIDGDVVRGQALDNGGDALGQRWVFCQFRDDRVALGLDLFIGRPATGVLLGGLEVLEPRG